MRDKVFGVDVGEELIMEEVYKKGKKIIIQKLIKRFG